MLPRTKKSSQAVNFKLDFLNPQTDNSLGQESTHYSLRTRSGSCFQSSIIGAQPCWFVYKLWLIGVTAAKQSDEDGEV